MYFSYNLCIWDLIYSLFNVWVIVLFNVIVYFSCLLMNDHH